MKDDQDKTKRRLLSEIYIATDYEYLSRLSRLSRSLENARAAKLYNITHLIITPSLS